MNIAVLLTCHNRKDKTIACLDSLFKAELPPNYTFEVYLVDDGSTDGTSQAVNENFPDVNVIKGSGDLFWTGGMRLAWKTALKPKYYNSFLLLNDDVTLKKNFLINLISTDQYVQQKYKKRGIYSSCTIDKDTKEITYGGSKILSSGLTLKIKKTMPGKAPQACDMTNANILWVSKEVVDKIGVLDEKFTHGIADYDYSLRAKKNGFPVFITPGIGGYCTNDHGVNWESSNSSLKERIEYLKTPTGLSYKNYLLYIKRHFPLNLPYAFIMLWLKTLFPKLWEKLKK